MRTKLTVPPIGPTNAKIAIVGEAPGGSEIASGRPFVGPAGKKLKQLLSSVQINYDNCYVTNVIKEQPSSIDDFIKFTKSGRATSSSLYDEYEQELYDELNHVDSNIIIAVGSIAMWAVTRMHGISKLRGSLFQTVDEIEATKKCIPIYHPSYLLRVQFSKTGYLLKYPTLHDLAKAKKLSANRQLNYLNRDMIIRPSFEDCIRYFDKIRSTKLTAFDIEVGKGLGVLCISFAVLPTDGICIPIFSQGEHYFSEHEECIIWQEISLILYDKDIVKVGQNLSFDCSFLLHEYGIVTRNCEDTMVAYGVAFPDLPKSLAFLVSMYTNQPYYKDDIKQWIKIGKVAEETFWRYNALDSLCTLEVFGPIKEELNKLHCTRTYKEQVKMIPPLTYMAEIGINIDTDAMKNAKEEAKEKIDQLEEELERIVGRSLNYKSPKEMRIYFYGELGMKPYTNRKTGKPTLDKDALKRISVKGNKEAKIILKLRKYDTLLSRYLKMRLRKGRMVGSFNPVGTTSLRLSSSSTIFGEGGNLQNLPPEITNILLPDPDYIAFSIDLGQAENRVVALIAPDKTMLDAFNAGEDIHSKTASLIFGKPIDDISDEPGSCPLGDGSYSERFWGKKTNHAFNYGQGPNSFAQLCEITQKEGKYLYNAYHAVYPGVKQMWSWIKYKLNKDRIITNVHGDKRIFLGKIDNITLGSAYSWIPQSTIAKIINGGILYIFNNPDFQEMQILNQVHDSILFQIPILLGFTNIAEEILSLIKHLEQPIEWEGRSITIPADLKIGKNFGSKTMSKVSIHKDTKSLAKELESTWKTLNKGSL